MGLLRLVPQIQEHILFLPGMVGRQPITERMLRLQRPPEWFKDFPRVRVWEYKSPALFEDRAFVHRL